MRSDIDYPAIEPGAVDDDSALFYLVVGASFIESASDLYTSNLVAHYREDAVLTWLTDAWQWQELPGPVQALARSALTGVLRQWLFR